MPVRYMGTKRYLAARVREAVASVHPVGPVVDLFSGIGAVTSALAPDYHVITNDALAFTTVLARARFLSGRRTPLRSLLPALRKGYRRHEQALRPQYGTALAEQAAAMEGSWQALAVFMTDFPHVASSSEAAARARTARDATGGERYCLATLYFAGGYFSVRQAIQLDALRFAIDTVEARSADREWFLAAWLSAAATVINAPGHTAQFLKVKGEGSHARVRRAWARDVWQIFLDRLGDLRPEGNGAWRSGNKVHNRDALELITSRHAQRAGVVYADPPYTKDHYSRYYHVYETLYRYDFPESIGEGRYRADRFVTGFSVKTKVKVAFEQLVSGVRELGVPLVLSYPENGLLAEAGVDLEELLSSYFRSVQKTSHFHEHSTLGASKGEQKKRAVERIYVCSGRASRP